MKKFLKFLVFPLITFLCLPCYAQQKPIVIHNGLALTAKDKQEWKDVFTGKTHGITQYRLITFDRLLNDQQKSDLVNYGVEILEYIHSHTYLCSINQNNYKSDEQPDGLSEIYPFSPSFKLSTNLLYGNPCLQDGTLSKLVIQCMPNSIHEDFIREIQQKGIQLRKIYAQQDILYLSANASHIKWLSQLPQTKFMDCESAPGEPEDREGRSLHRVNLIGANPLEKLNLDGNGVKVMVRDDGFVGPHIDFHGRITNGTYNDIGEHGDGVAGILTGAGNLDPLVMGMAPGAELFVINYQPDFLDNTLDYHQQEGVVITNSSYSNGCNVGYTLEAQVVDKQLWENRELLHVFSAGNSNNLDCGYGAGNQWGNVTGGHKIAKNCLTVANLRLDGNLEASSSRGPTKDRRMKPEISARGANELSTAPGQGTQVFGGTSAAAPGVAGVCALLYQAYKQFNNGKNPESALIKAAIMNTATDIGTPGPDYQFGFGVIDAYRAYKLLENKSYRKDIIRPGQQIEIKYNVLKDQQLVKFMIYWPEQEASLLSPKALINDVDLVVKSPTGTILKPWTLNPTPDAVTLAAGAFPGTDTLNNVEQVSVVLPEPGEYTLTITGKFIPSSQVEVFTLFESEDHSLRLTYPIGGEQFNITETTQIHYTAYGVDSIQILLSTNAGKDWIQLKKQVAGTRLYDFSIPNNVSSDSCLVQIRQGNLSSTSGYFTITSGVLGFKINRYCIGELELGWSASSKDSFKVYQLQEKYMDPIAVTSDTKLILPNQDPRQHKWFSVAGFQGTSLSRRELAIVTPDTLIGCNITKDLGLAASPKNPVGYYACQETHIQPIFQVINRSSNTIQGFNLFVEGDLGIQTETFTDLIGPYDTLEVTFLSGIVLKGNHSRAIRAWVKHLDDENPFNDTLQLNVQLQALPETLGTYPLVQDFNQSTPPFNWLISNPLDNATWVVAQATGKNGSASQCLMLNNPNPVYRNQPITLTSQRADLTQAVEPYLYFDFAHHALSSSQYQDSLQIIVKEICDLNLKETVLFSGRSLQYKTVDASATTNWSPRDTSWYWLAFDLADFKGSEIVVEFVVFRGHENRTFIDHFEIREKYPETSIAKLEIEPSPACYTKNVKLTPVVYVPDAKIYLDAGIGASPRMFDGLGPHTTRFIQQGDKVISMHVKSNLSNDIILLQDLSLANAVAIGYNYTVLTGRTVQFNNLSLYGTTYAWSFGDGQTSSEFSPIHTFDSAKIYRVKLTVTNPCGTYSRSVEVDLTLTQTEQTSNHLIISLYPNPVRNFIALNVSKDMDFIRITDSDGQLMKELTNVRLGDYTIDCKNWPAGLYTLQAYRGNKVNQLKILKIE